MTPLIYTQPPTANSQLVQSQILLLTPCVKVNYMEILPFDAIGILFVCRPTGIFRTNKSLFMMLGFQNIIKRKLILQAIVKQESKISYSIL